MMFPFERLPQWFADKLHAMCAIGSVARSERFTCPDRMAAPPGPYRDAKGADMWDVMPNGDRCCSYCGSMSFDDFYRLVQRASDPADGVRVEPSTKGYKWYVHQPGIPNASKGAIKFYTWHLPSQEETDKLNAIIRAAQRESRTKFDRELSAMMGTASA